MKKEFDLRYEKWERDAAWVDTKGTIRTTPENYYVADVNFDNSLEFGNIEDCTRNINQAKVKEWWRKQLNKKPSVCAKWVEEKFGER